MSFLDYLYITLFTKQVGVDILGNRYFISNRKNHLGQNKRYVIYKTDPWAFNLPASWHSWLHYMSDNIPNEKQYMWNKVNLNDLDQMKQKYYPQIKAKRNYYETWKPTSDR